MRAKSTFSPPGPYSSGAARKEDIYIYMCVCVCVCVCLSVLYLKTAHDLQLCSDSYLQEPDPAHDEMWLKRVREAIGDTAAAFEESTETQAQRAGPTALGRPIQEEAMRAAQVRAHSLTHSLIHSLYENGIRYHPRA